MTEQKQTIRKLRSELKHLKSALKVGLDLEVRWLPGRVKKFHGEKLRGEVLGDVIHIYDRDEKDALSTLRHEYFDFAVCEIIDPFKSIANKLISVINEEAYRKKEKLIERLSAMKFSDDDGNREQL